MRENSFQFGFRDFLWKILIFLILIAEMCLFGFIGGICSFIILRMSLLKYLEKYHKMNLMDGTDEIFFHDDERQCGNVVGFLKMEKFNFDELRRV